MLLPLLAQMPPALLGPGPQLLGQILSATWRGWEVAGSGGCARDAAGQAYAECLAWAVCSSPRVRDAGRCALWTVCAQLWTAWCTVVPYTPRDRAVPPNIMANYFVCQTVGQSGVHGCPHTSRQLVARDGCSDCLIHDLQLNGEAHGAFCSELLGAAFDDMVIGAALSTTSASSSAAETVTGILKALSAKGTATCNSCLLYA